MPQLTATLPHELLETGNRQSLLCSTRRFFAGEPQDATKNEGIPQWTTSHKVRVNALVTKTHNGCGIEGGLRLVRRQPKARRVVESGWVQIKSLERY